jgi:hypothetical protein
MRGRTPPEAFLAGAHLLQGAAPQRLSCEKAFQPLLEIGAVAGRSFKPARRHADSREPARTNSPTGNSPREKFGLKESGISTHASQLFCGCFQSPHENSQARKLSKIMIIGLVGISVVIGDLGLKL